MKRKPTLDPNFKPYRAVISWESFGGDTISREVRIVGERVHGYDCASGGWTLNRLLPTDTPARWIAYIPKWHRNIRTMNVKGVKIEKIEAKA